MPASPRPTTRITTKSTKPKSAARSGPPRDNDRMSNPNKVTPGQPKGRGGTPPKYVSTERGGLAAFDKSPSGKYLANKTGNKANMSKPSKKSR